MTRPDTRTCRTETVTFPATGPSVGEARRWLSKLLDGHPRHDDAVLLLSEAVTNSLVHTDSPTVGVTVAIEQTGDVRIEIADEGGPTIPSIPPHPADDADDDPASSGRGIRLIRTLSTHWGFTESRPHCILWFVLALSHERDEGCGVQDAMPGGDPYVVMGCTVRSES
ncbi:ATP-binding protein [Sphaerisporangium album]|nr:ATP-binding protein [Sphaerisporangium album]